MNELIPYAIHGFIWYQGESNRRDGLLYYHKMKAMINGVRKVWDQGEFPFYFVQIAPFRYSNNDADYIPYIWESQMMSLDIPNTEIIGTMDIGNLDDIHPKNKQEVGRRLALVALAKTYGHKNQLYSGPRYKSSSRKGAAIRITFDFIGSGLASRDEQPLTWFEIAGTDENYVPANATIKDNVVFIESLAVPNPTFVRFSWNQIAEPNLMNKEGFPAFPFRIRIPDAELSE